MGKKTLADLNKTIWYRALKVFFVFLFLINQGLGISIAYSATADQTQSSPTDEHFSEVGKRIKDKYPKYSELSDLMVGQAAYEKSYSTWLDFENPSGDRYAKNPGDYKEITIKHYSLINKFLIFSAVIISITLFYWFVLSIFYYIALGTFRPRRR